MRPPATAGDEDAGVSDAEVGRQSLGEGLVDESSMRLVPVLIWAAAPGRSGTRATGASDRQPWRRSRPPRRRTRVFGSPVSDGTSRLERPTQVPPCVPDTAARFPASRRKEPNLTRSWSTSALRVGRPLARQRLSHDAGSPSAEGMRVAAATRTARGTTPIYDSSVPGAASRRQPASPKIPSSDSPAQLRR
jgi:hypothetical protein